MDELNAVLAALGLKFVNVIVGAVSSFVTLRFFDGLSFGARLSTFLGGWACAAWGAPPLVEFVEAGPKVEILFVLLLGFFGMAMIAEIIKLIRETNWKGIFLNVVDRFLNVVDRFIANRKGG